MFCPLIKIFKVDALNFSDLMKIISHFNVRQYVGKLDQFIYMLELNHILFPAKTGMNVKRGMHIFRIQCR